MKFSEKEKDSMIWLYIKGSDPKFIATCSQFRSRKAEWIDIWNCIWDIMRGVEPFAGLATQAAFDKSDWTLREEYILREMRGFNQSPQRCGDILGRGHDQIKRKWIEMRDRDAWLREYVVSRKADLRTQYEPRPRG